MEFQFLKAQNGCVLLLQKFSQCVEKVEQFAKATRKEKAGRLQSKVQQLYRLGEVSYSRKIELYREFRAIQTQNQSVFDGFRCSWVFYELNRLKKELENRQVQTSQEILDLFQTAEFQLFKLQIGRQLQDTAQFYRQLEIQIAALQDEFVAIVEAVGEEMRQEAQVTLKQVDDVVKDLQTGNTARYKPFFSKEAAKLLQIFQFHQAMVQSEEPEDEALPSMKVLSENQFDFIIMKREFDTV